MPQTSINNYYGDVSSICSDPTKTNIDAHRYALRLGLDQFVSVNMNKSEICQIMNNYLNIIKHSRRVY